MDYGPRTVFFRKQSELDKESGDQKSGSDEVDSDVNAILEWFTGLSGYEAICWGYGICLSDIDELYWSKTDDDISTRLRLKLGEVKAIANENLQSLSFVVSSALGGKKPPTKSKGADKQAMRAFKEMFGKESVAGSKDEKGKDIFEGLDEVFEKMEKSK